MEPTQLFLTRTLLFRCNSMASYSYTPTSSADLFKKPTLPSLGSPLTTLPIPTQAQQNAVGAAGSTLLKGAGGVALNALTSSFLGPALGGATASALNPSKPATPTVAPAAATPIAPTVAPATTNSSTPVVPQIIQPTTQTGQSVGGVSLKSGLSSQQVSGLQSLAQKPVASWSDTDKANWAYATNNGALPTISPASTPGTNGGGTAPIPPLSPTPTNSAPKPVVPNVPPEPSAAQLADDSAASAYKKSLGLSPEETAAQADLDRLNESYKSAYTNIGDQAIPLDFITGQQKSVEQRALNLAEPLQARLARMQAERTANTSAAQFGLTRADAALNAANAKNNPVNVNAGDSLVRLNPQTGQYESVYQAPKDTTDAGFTLSSGQQRYDAKGNLVASGPASSSSDAGFTLSPGQQRYDANGQLISSVPAAPKEISPEQQKLTAIVQSGLSSLTDMRQAEGSALGGLARETTIGNGAYAAAKNNLVDVIGRLRSGGAISGDEQKTFTDLVPGVLDSQATAKYKLDKMESMLSTFSQRQQGGSTVSQQATINESDPEVVFLRQNGASDADIQALGFSHVPSTTVNGSSLVSKNPNPSKVIQTSTGTYDFTNYATDPNWGNGVKRNLNQTPNLQSASAITSFIKSQAPNSPLTGEMILTSAQKYGVDPKVILAIAKQEANYATLGRAAHTFNPGNVGNVDSGANVNWGSWQGGVDALAKNISKRALA